MRRSRPASIAAPIAAMILGAWLVAGCKKRPSYDLSSPEGTVAGFFAALDKGRIPEDLDTFIADAQELQLWKFRCRTKGCTGGDFKIVEVAEMSGYRATLIVDYAVFGDRDALIMRGQKSPLQLERQGDQWLLLQFGKRISAPKRDGGPDPAPAAPPAIHDGGPEPEGGTANDAGPGATEPPATTE